MIKKNVEAVRGAIARDLYMLSQIRHYEYVDDWIARSDFYETTPPRHQGMF